MYFSDEKVEVLSDLCQKKTASRKSNKATEINEQNLMSPQVWMLNTTFKYTQIYTVKQLKKAFKNLKSTNADLCKIKFLSKTLSDRLRP